MICIGSCLGTALRVEGWRLGFRIGSLKLLTEREPGDVYPYLDDARWRPPPFFDDGGPQATQSRTLTGAFTHRLLRSSFLWAIFRIQESNPEKELLRSLWVKEPAKEPLNEPSKEPLRILGLGSTSSLRGSFKGAFS